MGEQLCAGQQPFASFRLRPSADFQLKLFFLLPGVTCEDCIRHRLDMVAPIMPSACYARTWLKLPCTSACLQDHS